MNDVSPVETLKEQLGDARREVAELREALAHQVRLTAAEQRRATSAEDGQRRA